MSRLDRDQRAERHHVAAGVAHGVLLDRIRREPVRHVRLRIDIERAAKLRDLVHVGRAEVGLKGVEHVAESRPVLIDGPNGEPVARLIPKRLYDLTGYKPPSDLGSGKKYKKCCALKEAPTLEEVQSEELERILQTFYDEYPERRDVSEYLDLVEKWKEQLEIGRAHV